MQKACDSFVFFQMNITMQMFQETAFDEKGLNPHTLGTGNHPVKPFEPQIALNLHPKTANEEKSVAINHFSSFLPICVIETARIGSKEELHRLAHLH